MTNEMKKAIRNVIKTNQHVLHMARKQGQDTMGYIPFLEAFEVERLAGPTAMLEHLLEAECKKHGNFTHSLRSKKK